MEPFELGRIGEVDRSEEVFQSYVFEEGVLRAKDVHQSVPPWLPGSQGDHSVAGKMGTWWRLLENGGTMFGAFDDERLVAFAIYRPRLSADTAQLAVLHVSRPYRRRGLGARLAASAIEAARSDGATQLYVSSSPTKGTVDFYQSLGFRPTDSPNQELYELEPEDIHMTMRV